MPLVSKVSPAAVAEVYEDCRPCVAKIARNHARRRGGEPEEVMAEANYQFLRAYHNHDQDAGDVDAWVRYRVRINLLERARRVALEKARLGGRVGLEGLIKRDRFDVTSFMFGLSRDARLAVRLAVGLECRPASAGGLLRRELHDLGWGARQIADVFNEVREALSDGNTR